MTVSVKHMTKAQCLRIQSNNYCSEHDSKGNQFDYEANGYRDAIDQRLWELTAKNVDNMIKRGTGRRINESQDIISKNISKQIEVCEREISVNKAFFKWRNIVNELNAKFC